MVDLRPYLEKLEAVIDLEHVERARRLQEDAMSYREVDRLPLTLGVVAPDWETFPYSEAFYDMEKMLVNQLAGIYSSALAGDDRVYSIRANYGVGAIATMFGCKTRLVGDQMPYTEPLSREELDAVLEAGPPEITRGLGARVLETEEFYLKTFADYPKIAASVHVFVADTQGPFDIAHIIMGHEIYTEIYDNPERVHRLLDMACEIYVRYSQVQKELIGESGDWHYHGPYRIPGGVRVCEDSATNISTDSYLEFCRPYNERVLAPFNGGWVHYCGRGHQILESVITTPGVRGINFGNPEMQDMSRVLALAEERRVAIIGFPREHLQGHTPKTGMVLLDGVSTFEVARGLSQNASR